jgi:hypothetical protein
VKWCAIPLFPIAFPEFDDADRDFFDRVIAFYRLNVGDGRNWGEINEDLKSHADAVDRFIRKLSELNSQDVLLAAVAGANAVTFESLGGQVTKIAGGLQRLSGQVARAVKLQSVGKRQQDRKHEIIYILMYVMTIWMHTGHKEWIRRSTKSRHHALLRGIYLAFKAVDASLTFKTIKTAAEKAVPKSERDSGRFQIDYVATANLIDPGYSG